MSLNTLEKFLLIAQHPQKGRFITSDTHLSYGIIGAILLEMSLDEKVKIEDNRLVINPSHNGDSGAGAEFYNQIKNAKKPKKIGQWLSKFVRKAKNHKWNTLIKLAQKRLIRIEKKKFLGLFPYKKCYLIDSRTRDKLIRELNRTVQSKQDISNEHLLLLGLIEACKMHKALASNKEELKRIKKETKRIIKDSPIAESVNKTVQEVQAAIITTIIVASTASTVATSN